mgnify:CR=1 FL=1
MDAKQLVIDSVKNKLDSYMEIVQTLYDNPEIGNEEFESMALLVKHLEEAGFETESGYVVPTGFLGTYDTKKPGPTIAFMCEYDALPGMSQEVGTEKKALEEGKPGHGCGHNLLGVSPLATVLALKEGMDSEDEFKLVYYG